MGRRLYGTPVDRNFGNAADLVIAWNHAHPVGTAVILTDDFGKEHTTKTRSPAWVTLSGQALVSVKGRTGGYSLHRIRATEEAPKP